MKRTARYASRPFNKGKRAMITGLVDAFSRLKDQALSVLVSTVSWDYLDKPRALREAMKPQYTSGIPVHLQDQAVFDAVDTGRRFVDSCLARTHARGGFSNGSAELSGATYSGC